MHNFDDDEKRHEYELERVREMARLDLRKEDEAEKNEKKKKAESIKSIIFYVALLVVLLMCIIMFKGFL